MEVSSNDNKYVLTLKDRGTGYLVTAPIPDKKAQTVRDAFMQHWCGHYGVPRVVVSDNGREFVNQLLTDTFIQLGIEHRLVPPYSPQSNGFIERQHRTINQALRSEKTKSNWALRLPLITATINNTSVEGSPFTPSQYAFGFCVNLPGQVFLNEISENGFNCTSNDTKIFLNVMASICKKSRRYENGNVYYEPTLFTCKKVWLKRANKKKLSSLYHGPYEVLDTSEHSMHILKNSQVEKVSLRNVKVFVPRETADLNENSVKENDIYNLRERNQNINYKESSCDDF